MWVLRARLCGAMNGGRKQAKAGADLCYYGVPGVPSPDILVSSKGTRGAMCPRLQGDCREQDHMWTWVSVHEGAALGLHQLQKGQRQGT